MISTSRITLGAFFFSAGALVLITGRSVRQALERAQADKENYSATAQSLESRNKQLSALYAVFSEITETLSVRYVVQATLRETLKLMEAQGAVIWLLEDEQLVPTGS